MPLPAPDTELLDQLALVFAMAAVDALVQGAQEDFDADDSNVVPSPDDADHAPAGR